ncbi:hypothetical protein BP00DRAFT_427350 [Aspergillus indologenus CBS 114.80]|uniref:Uncharacterized protein n=1 Tax=Aspergillus indologenus CBS 114.80 TaxID=1450541 RepID=A0A2V5IM70_9EURO|nr:hypothetical protein BP00DRAFT_427350 [Aspergillus indologenus CBS 114.80]
MQPNKRNAKQGRGIAFPVYHELGTCRFILSRSDYKHHSIHILKPESHTTAWIRRHVHESQLLPSASALPQSSPLELDCSVKSRQTNMGKGTDRLMTRFHPAQALSARRLIMRQVMSDSTPPVKSGAGAGSSTRSRVIWSSEILVGRASPSPSPQNQTECMYACKPSTLQM